MNKELASIFVPIEVAKLAKEKGFNEWCAGFYNDDYPNEYFPNAEGNNSDGDINFEYDWVANNTDFALDLPTHYQLIKWLNEKYHIDICMKTSGLFQVIGSNGLLGRNKNGDTYSEINEALTIALNLIEVEPC